MAYLVFILAALALFIGFFVLTQYEGRRSVRFFESTRARLDRSVRQIEFVFTHVDLGAFLRAETGRVASRVGHDIAHLSLRTVRTVERLLTRLVRHLRPRHTVDTVPPRESSREFVKTLSDFKDHLEANRPEVPEVQ
ncbi:hypothetical protein KGQ25_02365 [Patescibacteria group bacterium]|nr:hypothetical protein [Patescibacteria group bacterium]